MHFTRIDRAGNDTVQRIQEQPGGSHADEIETSMMLYIDSACVDMTKAASDFNPGRGPLTPDASKAGIYSPTGIYGDATLATVEKGRLVVEATVTDLVRDIASLRDCPLPTNEPDAPDQSR